MIKELVSFADERSVDFVLCVGDLFDKHKPSQQVKDYLIEELINGSDINWIFTVGNHDYENKMMKYHSLKTLQILEEKFPNVIVLEPGSVYGDAFDAANIVCGSNDFKFIYKRTLKDNSLPVIGAYHGFVPWFDVKNGMQSKDGVDKFLNDTGLDYLALGDIHKTMKFSDRCWYPGALVQKTYGCVSGLLDIEIDDESVTYEVLDLGLPKKITINLEYTQGESSEEDIVALVKKDVPEKSLLKIKFNVTMPVWAGINKDKLRDDLQDHLTELVLEHDPVYGDMKREHASKFTEAGSLKKEIEVLIENCSLDVDKEELTKTCAKYTND